MSSVHSAFENYSFQKATEEAIERDKEEQKEKEAPNKPGSLFGMKPPANAPFPARSRARSMTDTGGDMQPLQPRVMPYIPPLQLPVNNNKPVQPQVVQPDPMANMQNQAMQQQQMMLMLQQMANSGQAPSPELIAQMLSQMKMQSQ